MLRLEKQHESLTHSTNCVGTNIEHLNEHLNDLLNREDLSRKSIMNDKWHDCYPEAAKLLWRFQNWGKVKMYFKAMFHTRFVKNYAELDVNLKQPRSKNIKMSRFEILQPVKCGFVVLCQLAYCRLYGVVIVVQSRHISVFMHHFG